MIRNLLQLLLNFPTSRYLSIFFPRRYSFAVLHARIYTLVKFTSSFRCVSFSADKEREKKRWNSTIVSVVYLTFNFIYISNRRSLSFFFPVTFSDLVTYREHDDFYYCMLETLIPWSWEAAEPLNPFTRFFPYFFFCRWWTQLISASIAS